MKILIGNLEPNVVGFDNMDTNVGISLLEHSSDTSTTQKWGRNCSSSNNLSTNRVVKSV